MKTGNTNTFINENKEKKMSPNFLNICSLRQRIKERKEEKKIEFLKLKSHINCRHDI